MVGDTVVETALLTDVGSSERTASAATGEVADVVVVVAEEAAAATACACVVSLATPSSGHADSAVHV